MTEEEWLTCEHPESMLHAFRVRGFCAPDRKFRLFAVSCCRRVWGHLTDARSRSAVEVTEWRVEGNATDERQREAHDQAGAAYQEVMSAAGFESRAARAAFAAWSASAEPMPHLLAYSLIDAATFAAEGAAKASGTAGAERVAQSGLCRDVFGYPPRPAALDPRWRTDTAALIAWEMYRSRDFGAMPILADALQDAGCEDVALLAHCRSPGPHVRGCWAVDLVLGKE